MPATIERRPKDELTVEDAGLFLQAEQTVRDGMQTFVEVGEALAAIRDKRWYRSRGYTTFEEYCEAHWGFSRQRAHQFISSAAIVADLKTSTIVDVLPGTESHVRPLAAVEPEARGQVWEEARVAAATEERPVAARDVQAAADRHRGVPPKPAPPAAPPDPPSPPVVTPYPATMNGGKEWHVWCGAAAVPGTEVDWQAIWAARGPEWDAYWDGVTPGQWQARAKSSHEWGESERFASVLNADAAKSAQPQLPRIPDADAEGRWNASPITLPAWNAMLKAFSPSYVLGSVDRVFDCDSMTLVVASTNERSGICLQIVPAERWAKWDGNTHDTNSAAVLRGFHISYRGEDYVFTGNGTRFHYDAPRARRPASESSGGAGRSVLPAAEAGNETSLPVASPAPAAPQLEITPAPSPSEALAAHGANAAPAPRSGGVTWAHARTETWYEGNAPGGSKCPIRLCVARLVSNPRVTLYEAWRGAMCVEVGESLDDLASRVDALLAGEAGQ